MKGGDLVTNIGECKKALVEWSKAKFGDRKRRLQELHKSLITVKSGSDSPQKFQ